MKQINPEKLIRAIDKKVEWHQRNQNDPHSIDTAVIAVLVELRSAIKEAIDEQPTH